MPTVPDPSISPAPSTPASPEERRWLHDKYQRLALEESQLAAGRTSYFAAVATVLVTGVVVAIADLLNQRFVLAAVATYISVVGIVISVVWSVLLHRTNDAQALWREAALRLEEVAPPVEGELDMALAIHSGAPVHANLLRPYEMHRRRFARSTQVPWMDRTDPEGLTELLPIIFLGIWVVVLAFAWGLYLLH